MKAMTMKGMAALVTTAEDALRPGRDWFGFLPWRPKRAASTPTKGPQERETGDPSAPEPTIYRFILRHSLASQILLLLFTLVSFPFLYYSLVLPKTIMDGAIKSGKHFPQHILGFEFDQLAYLMLLCVAFLALVFINGAFKYYINTFKGRLGERMLRRFRYQLYQRMLLFPLSYFQKNSSAQIIPMITAECDSLGGFIGEALNTPVFQGGQLLTNIVFMFMQNPILGLAAVALYPVQGYVIPKLQLKVNQLNRRRVRTVRQVADRVQESATGIADILANDTVKLQLTGFSPPTIANTEDLVHLSEVTVGSPTINVGTLRSLLKLPNVRRLCHPKHLAFDSVIPKEAIERGIEVVRY